MFSPGELLDKLRTAFLMVEEHGYSMSDLNDMFPFEFELQTLFILEHLEHQKKLKQRQ